MCIYLIIGVILFGLTHLYPAVSVNHRRAVIRKIGVGPYKGIYSLFILFSLFMIVYGWRTSPSVEMYSPPEWGPFATQILMYPVLFLFISASIGGNIKQIIRHPQLSSITLWGLAHLLANGESRAIVLFGTFAIWSLTQISLTNRRDGAWQKPEELPLAHDIKAGVIALVVYIALLYGHSYFTDISLI